MRGSKLAAEIIADMKREEYFKKKAVRKKCIIDGIKKCDECRYQDICEEKE